MKEKTVRIVSGSYSRADEGVNIELFGKTENEESITLIYEDFRPYFELVEPPEDVIEDLKEDEEIREIVDEELWVDGESRSCKKIICTYPWKVPGYRKKLKDRCKVLAADIPFVHRFIYDLDLGSTVLAKGDMIEEGSYTTDRVMKVQGFEETEPIKPEFRVLSFDIENSLDDDSIFTIACVLKGAETKETESFDGGEKEIIEKFQQYVLDKDPDIITGYNINGYDLPLLKERVEEIDLDELRLGRDRDKLRKKSNRYWTVNGRIIADAWWSVKSELNLKRETLNHVSKELLNEEKDDVDPSEIDDEWEENPEKVKRYCVKDAELALEILLELEVLDKAMDMGTVARLPVEEGLNPRTSTLVDSILIRKADRNDIGVPLTSHGGKGSKIKGGYVHSVDPGLYHWVSVLDFKSMYPSIIIQNNICFTTISKSGEIESPTGVKFVSPEKKKGLLPEILEDLMKERDEVKEKMKKAEGKKERYFRGLQNAIKVLMNSFYGVFASSFYRFTNPDIGESITASARENIKKLIEELQDEDIKVIYSDTDSVFFQSPKSDLEDTIEISERIAEEYSREEIILEFEKVLNPFFSHGRKKRYVGRIIWPEEDMLVRGYELRRSDSFEAQDRALREIFQYILDDDIEGAIERAKDWIEELRRGEVDLENLVISRTCKKFSRYKNPESMPNVQAAKKMKELDYKFTPGMKVSWIVIDASQTPQKVEPWLPDHKFEEEPDWEYYARRIAKTLARVTEVFSWDEKALLSGTKQSDLFSDEFAEKDVGDKKKPDEEEEKRKEGSKKIDKSEEVTLEDFT
ncbi:MAG: ribonuclease H-like domain-containing protein [Candidatus Thermoplasmatota archaeon]|nr:ribonuclease H-like domain-containing protein [Candidatus Thermoplasmatota archaeon]